MTQLLCEFHNCTSHLTLIVSYSQGNRQRGASGARPPFEIGAPPFHVWPLSCCIHLILYFKNVAPFWFLATPGFCPPLLLNPGDGPGCNVGVFNKIIGLAVN